MLDVTDSEPSNVAFFPEARVRLFIISNSVIFPPADHRAGTKLHSENEASRGSNDAWQSSLIDELSEAQAAGRDQHLSSKGSQRKYRRNISGCLVPKRLEATMIENST